MLQDSLPNGLPSAADLPPGGPRGLGWRVPLWFATVFVALLLWHILTGRLLLFGVLLFDLAACPVFALFMAWAFGLFDRGVHGGVRFVAVLGSFAVAILSFAAFLVLVMAGGTGHPPPRWRNVAGLYDLVADLALRDRFPVGIRERDMIVSLRADGFTVDPAGHRAVYRWSVSYACTKTFELNWTAQDGRLRSIRGPGNRMECF
ncbi:MAG: hypothetical protein WDM91_05275 [Rhizomicrobium sp.]